MTKYSPVEKNVLLAGMHPQEGARDDCDALSIPEYATNNEQEPLVVMAHDVM